MPRLLILLALLTSTALAQSSTDITGGLAALLGLGTSPVALGVFVFGLVATIKRQADKTPNTITPWAWRSLAAAVGIVGAVVLHLSNAGAELALFGSTGWLSVAFFGLVAGLVAVIGRDGLKTILSWIGAAIAGSMGGGTVGTVRPLIIPDETTVPSNLEIDGKGDC